MFANQLIHFIRSRDDANNEQVINLKREHESQRKNDFSKFEDPNQLHTLKSGLPEKINQLQSRESLNSCGTVSRKTSTASDYTPEHTYVQDSKPQFLDQTNVIYSTESCMAVVETASRAKDEHAPTDILPKMENGAHGDHLDLKPGQKVDVKILLLRQDTKNLEDTAKETKVDLNEVKETTIIAANVDKLKEAIQNQGAGEEVKPKVAPQRKISRFLVTPVLSALEMPKDKDYGQSAVDSPIVEMSKTESFKMEEAELMEQPKLDLIANKVEVARRDSIPLEIKPVSEVERGQEVTLEVGPKEPTEGMIGPEMITLEQLKKSLDDLKYSGGVRECLSGDNKSQKVSQAATPVPQVHPIQTPQNQVSSISMSICQAQPTTPLVTTAIPPATYPINIPSSVPQNITYSPQISQAAPPTQIPMPLTAQAAPIAQLPPAQAQAQLAVSQPQPQLPPVQPPSQTQLPTVPSVAALVPPTEINAIIPQSSSLPQQPQMAVHFPAAVPTSIPQQPMQQQLPTNLGGVSPMVPLQQGLISPPQVAPAPLPTQSPQAVLTNVTGGQQTAVLPSQTVVPPPQQTQAVLSQANVTVSLQQGGVDDKDRKSVPNLKLAMDGGTTNYAQTPTDAKYNAHMQFLQQQLSSITMTNQVPVGGTPSATHAPDIPSSPVQEQDAAQFVAPKAKQLADLNTEIAKINSRRDSGEIAPAEVVCQWKEVEQVVAPSNVAKQLEVPDKERKVSRFRISVVKEPDDVKLAVPEKHEAVREAIAETSGGGGGAGIAVGHEEPSSVVKPEVRAAINDTYEILENIIIKSYGVQDPLNPDVTILQHAVSSNAPHIGTTAITTTNTTTPPTTAHDQKSPSQRLIKQNAVDVNSDDDLTGRYSDDQGTAGSIDHLKFKLRKIFSNSSSSIQMQILYPKYSKKQIEKSLPNIVIHPPEESVSKSLPDIHAFFRSNNKDDRFYSEHEDSDVETSSDRAKSRDYKSDTDSRCTVDSFSFPKKDTSKRSIQAKYRRRRKLPIRTFSLSERGKNRRLSLQNPKLSPPPMQSTLSYQNLFSSDSDCSETKRIRLYRDASNTAPIVISAEDPSNWLRFKQKQSLSMHSVYSNCSDYSLSKYHTIHSPCESGMSSRFPRRRIVKKSGSFDEIIERTPPVTSTPTSYSTPFLIKTDRNLDLEDASSIDARLVNVEIHSKGTQCDCAVGEMAKCCCGNKVCSTVVPIHQYLETYFMRTAEESFEEMLNRQKAELNALMEAHRKQQLAFMRITEQKKSQSKDDEINANN
ncbi:hypothetical protein QE152_g23574 [Popillia japonica]|uniref:Uncharacterized protein n=1 Tax=Popillia japonica TaxID=7064 RepID=A0AAW1KGM0_POPJA